MIKPVKHNKKGANIITVFILSLLLICIAYALNNIDLSNNTGSSGNDLPNLTVSPTLIVTQPPTPTLTPAYEPTVTSAPTPVPVLHPSPAPEPVPETIGDLKRSLEEYIDNQDGRYGLYYINLVTGDEFGINHKERFIAASTTKLPMNLLLYKKVALGEVDLNDKLVYLEEDFEPGAGIIQDSPFGTEYTVRETARLSIIYSDNCGINMIIRLLGIDNIRQYMQDIGGTIYYGRDHRSCPYDLAVYARELYRFYQQEPEIAGILIEDLQNTMWNDRINKLLPEEIKVAHKIGNFDSVYNDVGIIFTEEPYALAIMSEDIEQSVASNVIAQLSKKIYDYVVTSIKESN
ncbi:MAG: serine hydrolase [Clostridiaceae bacterium]|nr:serine hydrolase [Clostridiaceae bacterium]